MLCLCTGFCAFTEPRKDSLGDNTVYEESYFEDFFFPYHLSQVDFAKTFVYESLGDKFPKYNGEPPVTVRSALGARSIPHSFGWFASVMMGAQFCLLNKLDMVYVEQDALIYRLKDALEFAKGKKIVYGYGKDVSWCENWAEHSFFYVSNSYLSTFLSALNGSRIHENVRSVPEVLWHSLFKDVADFWEFGCGRRRPIPFDGDGPLFAQQLRRHEIEKFKEKLDGLLSGKG